LIEIGFGRLVELGIQFESQWQFLTMNSIEFPEPVLSQVIIQEYEVDLSGNVFGGGVPKF
jgi:hypothetical protein